MVFLRSIVLSAGLLLGCHPPQSLVQDRKDSGFVYAEGTDLKLGGKKFYFVGVNIGGLANDSGIYVCRNAPLDPKSYIQDTFDTLKSHRINTIRFYAFQGYTKGGEDFSSMDRIVRLAEDKDIKLIPVLANQWGHCPGDVYKDSSWYNGGYLDIQENENTSYREHVRNIVTRYRDSHAILMWQLVNEAESRRVDGKSDPESLYNFAVDMSQFIKSIDPNHLVSLGTISTGQPGTQHKNFGVLHTIKDIDIVEAHDYHHQDKPWHDSPRNSIGAAYNASITLGKPFFIGESGIRAGCKGCPSIEERVRIFGSKLDAAFSRDVDGYLLWRFEELESYSKDPCDNDPLCFTKKDPLMDLLEVFSPEVPRV